jgi:DNA-binding IclR family transcriptional regulator
MRNDSSIAMGYQAPAVHRAFQLLNLVATSPETLNLTGISRELGISKSTAHGLVNALLGLGLLDRHPRKKKFMLGSAMIDLAMNSLNFIGIQEKVQPYLLELRDRIGETVFLGALSRSRSIILGVAPSVHTINLSGKPGSSIPFLAGAVGKIYLASLDAAQANEILNQFVLPRFTDRSITDPIQYLSGLDEVRKSGYAVDDEEYLPGIRAVASAIGKYQGVFLALWVVGFSENVPNCQLPVIADAMQQTIDRLRPLLLHNPP